MSDGRPEVIVIEAIDPPPLYRPRRKRRVLRWPTRTLGIVATVLVHALFFSPLILGTSGHKARPTPDGIGTTAWASQGEEVEAMVLIDLSSMSGPQMELPKPDSSELAVQLEEEGLRLVSTNPIPMPEVVIEEETEESEEATQATGDPRGNAELFGKYMGHVTARIDRAWMRPRAPVTGGRFECRARLIQDRQGAVLSVSLDDCDADAKWRASLNSAILRAAPLSAPSEPWLFTELLTLQFSAEQFEAGRTPEHLYEPTILRVAKHETAPLVAPPPAGDVVLTITGSKVEWKKR